LGRLDNFDVPHSNQPPNVSYYHQSPVAEDAMTTLPIPSANAQKPALSWRWALLWAAVAVAAFHAAYEVPGLGLLMGLYLYGLVRLTEVRTARQAFYWGFAVGMACVAPQLAFFWTIFNAAALALWTVLATWIGFFTLIGWGLRQVPWAKGWLWVTLIAAVWTGLEYFRSELYYLRFAWLTPGMAIGSDPLAEGIVFATGVYGVGFLLAGVAALITAIRRSRLMEWAVVLVVLIFLALILLPSLGYSGPALHAVAIQLENPNENQVLEMLNQARAADPDKDRSRHSLLVMSEYNLSTPPTQRIRDWCREHGYWLLIGGIQPLAAASGGQERWANTAFVVDDNGEIVFTQDKCVPIQFFDDGVPAKQQSLWNSPWGKVGICICYDLSYSRVTDNLIRQGADALIVIAMDTMEWGEHEHNLHARIAPARAMEYHIDILRVASSGVTQCVSGRYGGTKSIPYPEQGITMTASLHTRYPGRLPPDRYLAPVCVVATGLVVVMLLAQKVSKWRRKQRPAA
jgi:apolipoprotein N-acyltransferase